jgi:hypothetical protein
MVTDVELSALMRQQKLFIATPMYGGNCLGKYSSAISELTHLCTKYGINIAHSHLYNESLIQRARNYIVDQFMRSDATHLMFIDADISFKAVDVIAMLSTQVSNPSEYDIIAAAYPKKSISWDKVVEAVNLGIPADQLEHYAADFAFNFHPEIEEFRLDRPARVMETGTGFMMIHRSVFEKMIEAFPEMAYTPDHVGMDNFDGTRKIHAFFDCAIDPQTNRYLSEDYYFCRRAAQLGLKTFICPWIVLSHVGTYEFKGSLTKMTQLFNALATQEPQMKED